MGIWRWWRKRRRAAILRRAALSEALWAEALAQAPGLFAGLDEAEERCLRKWTTLFLAAKEFYGARGFVLSDAMRAGIAVRACLPILNRDLDDYAGWQSIVVYEDSFIVPREETDEDGIVHRGDEVLAGESWEGGPVVLSWADCTPGAWSPAGDPRYLRYLRQLEAAGPAVAGDVVIHEFAHKLDMNNGVANGMPPLPREMSGVAWSAAMGKAYAKLQAVVASGAEPPIDAYAAEDPAEFFAVCSEYFFLVPAWLQEVFPEVYHQLSRYYRQDPIKRHGG